MGGVLQFSKLGGGGNATFWPHVSGSGGSPPSPVCLLMLLCLNAVSDFNTWSTLSPALDTHVHAQLWPTSPFCVILGFLLFPVQTKSKFNVLCGRKGQKVSGDRQ